MICCDGPPMPRTGPASPAGAAAADAAWAGTPLPAARPIPGPLPTPDKGTRGPWNNTKQNKKC